MTPDPEHPLPSRVLRPILVRAPADWMTGSVIRPYATSSYEVRINKNKCVWHMGIAMGANYPSPPLSWFDWKVFFAVLRLLAPASKGSLSYSHICEALDIAICGTATKNIKDALLKLRNYWVRLERPDGSQLVFSLLLQTVFSQTARQARLAVVEVRNELIELVMSTKEGRSLRFDQMRKLKSYAAGALYLCLPARAYYYEDRDKSAFVPFPVVAGLLGAPEKKDWMVKKLLTQHVTEAGSKEAGSVLQQIDGLAMKGGVFRVEVTEKGLICWCQREEHAGETGGKLLKAFERGGGKREHFTNAMDNPKLVGASESDLVRLAAIGIPRRMQPFIDKAKRFLDSFSPDCFLGVLTEVEKQFHEHGSRIRKPEAVIATIFCDLVEAAPTLTKHSIISGWWVAIITERLRLARHAGAIAKKTA